jgi:hypothetical protein
MQPGKINEALSLAFLAPDLVKAAIEGPLPHGMAVARLFDLPAEWSHQRPGGDHRGRKTHHDWRVMPSAHLSTAQQIQPAAFCHISM